MTARRAGAPAGPGAPAGGDWLPVPPAGREAARRLAQAKRAVYAAPEAAEAAAVAALKALGCRVYRSADPEALAGYVLDAVARAEEEAGGRAAAGAGPLVAWHPSAVAAATGLAHALDTAGVRRLVTPDRRQLFGAVAGVTGATALVRDTGTLVLAEDSGFGRAASNVPPVHIALITPDKLLPALTDVAAVVRAAGRCWLGAPVPRYVSCISGPSRTGDIAFRLVLGMHGPKTLHVVVWDSPWAAPPWEDGDGAPARLPARWVIP